MAKKLPTSMFSRGTKLAGLAGKVALHGIASGIKTWETEKAKLESKIELAQNVVKTLAQLKGASMKLGQLISLDLGEYLPPEVTRIVETLHNQVTFLPKSEVEDILRTELGEKFQRIEALSDRPIAAASIGQVHRARVDGKDVAIKVQYPGVAESIPTDIKLLRFIVKNLSAFQGKDLDMSPFFDEVEEVLRFEADYHHELKMQRDYRKKFKSLPYLVPEVYPRYSTGKVLTQEFIDGVSLTDWLATDPDPALTDEFADLWMKLYLEELFVHHMVQTDPNPGNFLITPENKIALLDFGSVKLYSKEFVRGYRQILLAAYAKDQGEVLRLSVVLKFLDERESEEVKALYLRMMDLLVEPFRMEGPFEFADPRLLKESRDLTWEMIRLCKFSPPPKDLLFLHRKLVGVFVFIKKLNAKVQLKNYWHYVEAELAPEEVPH